MPPKTSKTISPPDLDDYEGIRLWWEQNQHRIPPEYRLRWSRWLARVYPHSPFVIEAVIAESLVTAPITIRGL